MGVTLYKVSTLEESPLRIQIKNILKPGSFQTVWLYNQVTVPVGYATGQPVMQPKFNVHAVE